MLFFVACLMVITPTLFAGLAWRIASKDSLRSAGRFYLFLLSAVSFGIFIFFVTLVAATSNLIMQASVFRIAVPNFWACASITLICLAKIGHRRYQALLASAASLALDWLIFGSLH